MPLRYGSAKVGSSPLVPLRARNSKKSIYEYSEKEPNMHAIKRHPLITFFTLAFGISYAFYFLPLIVPGFPLLFPFGALIAAITVASITQGRAGLKDLLSRCLRWRVGLRWYAAALLVPVAIG